MDYSELNKGKVVFFVNILKHGAGMVNREIGFATELATRGWDITFLSYFKPQISLEQRNIKSTAVIPTPYFGWLYDTLIAWPIALTLILIKLFKIRPHIVCVDLPHEAYWALLLRPLFGYKVLFTYHGVDDPCFYTGEQADYFAKVRNDHYKLLPKADKAIIVSDYLQKQMDAIGVAATRIYNGVEHDVYNASKRLKSVDIVKPLILSLNRYTVSKGVFTIVKAFAKVLEEMPDAELVCFGIQEDRDYIRQIREFIIQEGIEDSVYLFGAVDSDEMPYRMCEATLFANAALYESFGMPMAEAEACGTPCVAFAIQGIPEVVLDKKTGLLAPAGDIDAYAQNMVQILTDSELRADYSRNAIAHCESFKYSELVNQLEPLLKELLDNE